MVPKCNIFGPNLEMKANTQCNYISNASKFKALRNKKKYNETYTNAFLRVWPECLILSISVWNLLEPTEIFEEFALCNKIMFNVLLVFNTSLLSSHLLPACNSFAQANKTCKLLPTSSSDDSSITETHLRSSWVKPKSKTRY